MSSVSQEDLDVHVLPVLNALLRHLRLIAATAVLLGALGTVVALVRGRSYTASSSFIPQSTSADPARLAGIAAQFGISLGSSAGGASPDFYVSLISSRAILEKVAEGRYTVRTDGGTRTGTAAELLSVKGRDSLDRLEKTMDVLRKQTAAGADMRSGVVTLSVTARNRDLASQLNRRILTELAAFNLTTRQSQARSERQFIEGRAAAARADLAAAEDAMTAFLESNRAYRESPQLQLEYGRLQRRVDLNQQLYSSLATNLERARIDEVRDTPVLTIVDGPELGVERSHGPLFFAAAGLVVGLLIGFVLAFVLEFMAYQRKQYPLLFDELTSRLRPVYRARIGGDDLSLIDRGTGRPTFPPS